MINLRSKLCNGLLSWLPSKPAASSPLLGGLRWASAPAGQKEKVKFERTKPHLNIGTVGHVDHGKTTLTAAITKILAEEPELGGKATYTAYEEIDKAPEEKSRGITIAASHLEYETPKKHITHIDCPGHSDYVKNMITGAAQMDTAILVVSAPDGIMPQTREHILLAKQIGVPSVIIFINKVDLVEEPDMLQFIHLEIVDLLKYYGFEGDKSPCVKGAALLAMKPLTECSEDEKKIGRGSIRELIKVLDDTALPPRPLQLPLMMPVENVYNITGRGVVVTGKIEQGTVKIGDNVEVVGINPNPVPGQCTGVEMFRKILDVGEAGENVGICLKGPKKEDCYRGQVLAKPGTIKTFKKFKADIFLLDKKEGGRQKPVGNNYKPQFFFRTADITGTVILPKADAMIMPGDHTNITVELIYTMPIEKGMRFTIREGGRTIGAGIILETVEEKEEAKKGPKPGAKPGAAGAEKKDAKPADKKDAKPAAAGAKPAAPAGGAKPAGGAAKPAPKK